MKQVLILFHCLLTSIFFSNCRQTEKPSSITATSDSLKKIILSQAFSDGTGGWALNLQFKPDKSYEFSYDSEGEYWYNRGSYILQGGSVQLKPDFCGMHASSRSIPCRETFNNGVCKVVAKDDDIEYSHYLRCIAADSAAEYSFHIESRLLPKGTQRSHEGHRIETLGNRKGQTILSCQLYKGPGRSYGLRYFMANEYEDIGTLKIPKGIPLIVHGILLRPNMDLMGDGAWYLVTTGDTQYAWIEGSCIKH